MSRDSKCEFKLKYMYEAERSGEIVADGALGEISSMNNWVAIEQQLWFEIFIKSKECFCRSEGKTYPSN